MSPSPEPGSLRAEIAGAAVLLRQDSDLDPLVALALADLLDGIVERHSLYAWPADVPGMEAVSTCVGCGRDADEESDCPDLAAAAALARLYVRSDS